MNPVKRGISKFLSAAGLLSALCLPVEAQQPARTWQIGYLSNTTPAGESARAEAIRLALRELGYVEGRNIAFEYRYAEQKLDRLPELAAELVRLNVDLIIAAGGTLTVRAAMNATKTIPIVRRVVATILLRHGR